MLIVCRQLYKIFWLNDRRVNSNMYCTASLIITDAVDVLLV